MKKILSIVLALTLVFALGATALAAEVTPASVNIDKTYTITGGTAAPAEELSFTVTPDAANLAGGSTGDLVVGTNNTATVSGDTKIPITFPTYSKVGVYKYTITETAGSTLGVTYDPDPLYVVVTVTNTESGTGTADALNATVAFHKGAADGEKEAVFENSYGLGQLTVSKAVSGNLASNEVAFSIKVTFTGTNAASAISYTVAGGTAQTLVFENGTAEATIQLKNSQSAVFTDIPAGVTYTVVEDAAHAEGADDPAHADVDKGYTVTYDTANGDGQIAAGDTDTVAVKNEKKTNVDTGIVLDSLPYVLAVFVVLGAAVLMIVRRRRNDEV